MVSLPSPYLLHPAAVHFPIVLLTGGWAAGFLSRRAEWLAKPASWLLWLGTVAAWVTLGLGLLAEETAPHVPAAWQPLSHHETLAFWTVGLFTALSLWRWRMGRRWEGWFLLLWFAACGVLVATAFEGGELVFSHGMGVTND